MPIIKSAIKKLRKDRKRTKINRAKKDTLAHAIKKAKKSKSVKDVQIAISLVDKAAKTHLIHTNKAARLKSRLAKLNAVKGIRKQVPAKAKQKTTKRPSLQTRKKSLH